MSFFPDRHEVAFYVVELAESFGHYHIARSIHASHAACGKRGRLARILPGNTWNAAPGPIPTSWCGRCSQVIGIKTREERLAYLKEKILERYAAPVHEIHHLPDWMDRETSPQAGVGYVDVDGEIRRIQEERERDRWSCTDWAPVERAIGRPLIYN